MDHKATMQRLYNEVFNTGNLEMLREFATPDFVDHNPDPGQGGTVEGVIEGFRTFRVAFPDLRMDVRDLISEGDRVVARVTMSGTHRGDLMGIPASGKKVAVELIDIVRFQGDKAAERWGQYDTMSFMQQIGAVPPQA